ncbi:signal recognition particle protein [Luminiphilus sp.]|jgi:signal recognition particle subunit SRP54|nr:signal recognition particle protein [Luminiphilus sp.]|tara:strand:+ start:2702 stop:4078 length:1377 start_codon:yes stop_codon:yes gene_type:complete
MFESLSDRLGASLKAISGKSKLTEDNIRDTLRDVRMTLLEADVALPVVKTFTDRVKDRAVGTEVSQSLSPGQAFLKVVQAELQAVMGGESEGLNLATQPPAVIMVAGLQGAGKTTSVAKLARYLIEREKKKVSVVSADVYRPAAIKQLETLAAEVGARFEPSDADEMPVDIVRRAIADARVAFSDVLLVDTAGRLAIDDEMMAEISALHEAVEPIETLFVVDAMTGQDAANTAKAFGKVLPLTGIILTKVDADTRGGAALSVRTITERPIKFLGVGEKTDALDPFHPDRLASRILGMGDMLSLIEDVERKVDQTKAKKLAKKVQKGGRFDLEDFREQLQQMKNLGGMGAMLDKMPGMGGMAQAAQNLDTQQFVRMEAMINSMTPRERRNPDLISGSRKRRITGGSGTVIQDLNRLLKQHKQMQKMMKKMKGGGMQRMMRGMGGMTGGPGGGLPPGFPR